MFKRINICFCYWEVKLHYFIIFHMSALFAIDINTNHITGISFMQCKHLLVGPVTANFVPKYWISLHKYMAFSHLSLCIGGGLSLCEYVTLCMGTLEDIIRQSVFCFHYMGTRNVEIRTLAFWQGPLPLSHTTLQFIIFKSQHKWYFVLYVPYILFTFSFMVVFSSYEKHTIDGIVMQSEHLLVTGQCKILSFIIINILWHI